MVALEDCSIMVSNVPIPTNIRIDQKPFPLKFCKNDKASGLAVKSGTESLRKPRPRKRRANPITISPEFFLFCFFDMVRIKPMAIRGMASRDISILNPSREIIQAVTVVPILAPIITPIACASESSPAFTKLTTMTVVALED